MNTDTLKDDVNVDMDIHPLTNAINLYCKQYAALRDEHLDLQPIAFHKRYGLNLRVPHNWNILSSVDYAIDQLQNFDRNVKLLVIFGSTDSYRKIYNVLDDRVQYFSWHEILTGIHTAAADVRYIQKVKQLLLESDLTFFLDPPPLPEVIDQVYGQAANCLVVLSGGGV